MVRTAPSPDVCCPDVRLAHWRRRGVRPGVRSEHRAGSRATEKSPSASPPEPRVTLVGTLAITVLWAWLVTVVLDASNFPAPLNALRNRTFDAPALLPSVMVVWVFVILVLALIGRLWVSLGVVTALTALLGAVNATKLDLRNDPVVPSDLVFLRQPGFLFDMVPKSRLLMGALGLVVVVLLAWGFGWLVAKVLPPLSRGAPATWRDRPTRDPGAGRGDLPRPARPRQQLQREGQPLAGGLRLDRPAVAAWDQRVNYQRNGFIAGLLFNTHVTAMAEPKGYSKAAVEEIAERYQAKAAAMNEGRTATIDKTNVVIVLSEGFSQPAWLKTVKFPTDVIPKTTAAMKKTVSGKDAGPGLRQRHGEHGVRAAHRPVPQPAVPSALGALRAARLALRGLPVGGRLLPVPRAHPVAIHPFSPRMYARTKVFETFGFDKFITKDDMKFKGRGGGRFIDDESAYNEVRHQIDTHDEPVLAHLITMQNHMPFGGQYDDPIKPTGLPPKYADLAGQYARGLARSDDALADMFAKLKKSPEPTAVIFYGDHLPPQVYPQSLVEREGAAHRAPDAVPDLEQPQAAEAHRSCRRPARSSSCPSCSTR